MLLIFVSYLIRGKIEELSEVRYLPKLCTDLIATLPTLDVKNLSHGALNICKNDTKSGNTIEVEPFG